MLQWTASFLLTLPSYFWPGSLYSLYESDYYCGIVYEKIFGLLYTVINIFVLPMIFLTAMYARLVYFISYQAPRISHGRQRRQAQRDLIVIRRILFTVIALALPGIPNTIFGIMSIVDFHVSGSYYMYRIQWMGPAVTVFIFSIALVFINSHMKQVLLTKLKYRRGQAVLTVIPRQELKQSSTHFCKEKSNLILKSEFSTKSKI